MSKTTKASLLIAVVFGGVGCTTLPTPQVSPYVFPRGKAFLGPPPRPYEVLGLVKTKVSWSTLNPDYEEDALCKNYFNKGAIDLVKRAQDAGGDAVAEVRAVVFTMDGKTEQFTTAECTDDGEEGQVLMQGVVVKWKPLPDPKSPAVLPPVSSPQKR